MRFYAIHPKMKCIFVSSKAHILLTFRYINFNALFCEAETRVGKKADGGWELCAAGPFIPTNPCLVYDFG